MIAIFRPIIIIIDIVITFIAFFTISTTSNNNLGNFFKDLDRL